MISLCFIFDAILKFGSMVSDEDLGNQLMLEAGVVDTPGSPLDPLSEDAANIQMITTLSTLLKLISTIIFTMFVCSSNPGRAPKCFKIAIYLQMLSAAIELPVRPMTYQEDWPVSIVICTIKLAGLLYFLHVTNGFLRDQIKGDNYLRGKTDSEYSFEDPKENKTFDIKVANNLQ